MSLFPMRRFEILIVAAVGSLLTQSFLFGNAARLPSQGIEAVARGYAFAATADDLSAMYYNPAGLALQKSPTVENGLYYLTPSTSYTSPSGTSFDQRERGFALPFAYAAFPIKEVVAGVSAYAPFGLSSDWDPKVSTFSTLATYNALVYRRYSATLAYALTPEVLVGVSVQYNRLRTDLGRSIGFIPKGGDKFNYTGAGTGYSWNFGLLYRPAAEHSFAFTYQANNTVKLDGVASYVPIAPAEAAKLDWVFPENFVLGYSWRPNRQWNLEFNYDWTRWSRLDVLTLRRAVSGPLPLVLGWKNSAYYCLGATRNFADNWHVSAGLNYSENSVPDATYSPSLPDYSKWIWNAGIGRKWSQWRVSSVIQYSPETTHTVTGSARSPLGETADGRYVSKLWAVGGQVAYSW